MKMFALRVSINALFFVPSLLLAAAPTPDETQKLALVDRATLESFGGSLATSGATAVVGAPFDSARVENSGSARVFVRAANGAWSLQSRLSASDGSAGDDFGVSVAISGDTAVIGADFDAVEGIDSGSAYVFVRDASGAWSQQVKLRPPHGLPHGLFGFSVATSGETVVIGAPSDVANGVYMGSAYVFVRDADGRWSQQAKIFASDGAARDFGAAVAISGDTVLIGARHDNGNRRHSGTAYVFVRDASGGWSPRTVLLGDGSAGFVRHASEAWSQQNQEIASDTSANGDVSESGAIGGGAVVVGAQPDNEDGKVSGAARVLDSVRSPGAHSAMLHCPGDIDGDGAGEVVLVTGSGRVRVKALDGTWVTGFDLAGPLEPAVHTRLMADTNGNGAPELVALEGSTAEVRDLLTGGELAVVAFSADLKPVDLALVPDQTGNGIPEIAVLGSDPTRVEIRDGLTGAVVNGFRFAGPMTGTGLVVFPDLNDNGAAEIAVLSDERQNRPGTIEIRDTATGAMVRKIALDRAWRVLRQARIADLDGNGSADVALLRVQPSGNVNVQIRDAATLAYVNSVGFARDYLPKELIALADSNGNGADELVVFGERFDQPDQKAVIKDSKTGSTLGQLWFDRNLSGQDFVSCGDVNGNGSTDLALLGRLGDARFEVIVDDGKTGERLAQVWF